jgi:hypothetical protein
VSDHSRWSGFGLLGASVADPGSGTFFTPGFEIRIRDSGYGIGKNPDPGSGIQIRDERILFLKTQYQLFRFKIFKFLYAISRIWDGIHQILDEHLGSAAWILVLQQKSLIVAGRRYSTKPFHLAAQHTFV